MAIGIDDVFVDDDFDGYYENDFTTTQDSIDNFEDRSTSLTSAQQDGDFNDYLLSKIGIQDSSRIKFEDEGEVTEVDWNDLDNETRWRMISTSLSDSNSLDSEEAQFLNYLRANNMTPGEYVNYVAQQSVQNFAQNQQQPVYKVDQYSDEELYVLDLMSKTEDITEAEALEALEEAKSNETLFAKRVQALRREYIEAEQQVEEQNRYEAEYSAQYQWNQFANQMANSISRFTEFSGYDLNLDEEDMQEIYEFVTGVDPAGVNHFTKALNDPDLRVKMAWFALHGEEMVNDITNYFKKEIANVRKQSYEKGLADSNLSSRSNVYYREKQKSKDFDILDKDF